MSGAQGIMGPMDCGEHMRLLAWAIFHVVVHGGVTEGSVFSYSADIRHDIWLGIWNMIYRFFKFFPFTIVVLFLVLLLFTSPINFVLLFAHDNGERCRKKIA